MQDVSDIEHAISHAMPRCIAYGGFLVTVSILMLITDWRLGLATVTPLLFGFALMFFTKNVQKRWTRKYFWKTRATNEAFQETIECQREIKSFGLTAANDAAVSDALERAEKLRLRSEIAQAIDLRAAFLEVDVQLT